MWLSFCSPSPLSLRTSKVKPVICCSRLMAKVEGGNFMWIKHERELTFLSYTHETSFQKDILIFFFIPTPITNSNEQMLWPIILQKGKEWPFFYRTFGRQQRAAFANRWDEFKAQIMSLLASIPCERYFSNKAWPGKSRSFPFIRVPYFIIPRIILFGNSHH